MLRMTPFRFVLLAGALVAPGCAPPASSGTSNCATQTSASDAVSQDTGTTNPGDPDAITTTGDPDAVTTPGDADTVTTTTDDAVTTTSDDVTTATTTTDDAATTTTDDATATTATDGTDTVTTTTDTVTDTTPGDTDVVVPEGLHLGPVTAKVTGRQGADVQLAFTATDSNRSIAGVMVRVLDENGAALAAFDSHQSGVLDSELGPASFAAPVMGLSSVTTTATIRGLVARAPRVGRVAVSLRDVHGEASDEVLATVLPQPVRQLGESCDPAADDDRCEAGFGCRGEPPTCHEGLAPQLAQLGYLRGSTGPIIIMSGTDPEDDLTTIHVAFEDASGNSIMVPLDGDNAPPSASFDLDATGYASSGSFLIALQQAQGFDVACPQIAVTPTDKVGHVGATFTALPTDPPRRAAGAACDPRGFDSCVSGQVCVPGPSPTCQSLATLQSAGCGGAVVLAPTIDQPATSFGHTALPSLWDAPRGCSGFNPTGRPEGVAQLVLAADATTLHLSLDNPGTDFDTTMYLLPGCPSSSANALACDDDNGIVGVSSVINMDNVPAGTYTVVIDSFKPRGGNYQLTATVE